jgi:hypothetical protein
MNAVEVPKVVEVCKKVRDELLWEGYVGAYDATFAELLAEAVAEEAGRAAQLSKLLEEVLLYDEAVANECGYWRYVSPGGDVLFFVDGDEVFDLLYKKREVKVLW